MRRERFERLVQKALASLPPELAKRLDNVDLVVEERPTVRHLAAARIRSRSTRALLGLYQGTPLTERTTAYGMVPPDKITIFQRPLEALCRSDQEVVEEVRRTVIHEVAHHFGISDERLKELGWN